MTQANDTYGEYDRQTEFRREEQHLETVVGTIDATIKNHQDRESVYAGDAKAADIVKELLDTSNEKKHEVRNRPYFGRIDYLTGADGDIKTIYIGDININHEDPRYFISSRNAPIASLYYRPADGSFETPRGKIPASVYLKRTLMIEDAQLNDFDDVLRLPTGRGQAATTSSRAIDERLAALGGGELADAVETIQPEQYEQIASAQKPVLIVQGAAGSGKSLIGLHRIDFILSPFSNIGSLRRPTAERVIMFGPSPAFLRYVSGLLPGLGVQRVRQTTVSQWLLSKFSARVTLSTRDRVFDDLMNNRRKLTGEEIEAHLFKTGLKMKRLIDNYVGRLGREVRSRVGNQSGISVAGYAGAPDVELSASSLKSRVREAFEAHAEPNVARAYFANVLAGEWAMSLPPRFPRELEMFAEGRRLVEEALNPVWERIDFRTEYVKLVSSPAEIASHARKGDVDPVLTGEIAKSAPSGAGQALGNTDLAAALYLDYALNGYQSERLEHVVVDEAQDVSPLEITLMQMHSANKSFTILGDLRQSVLPYKSVANWNQIASLFDRDEVSRLDSRLTYRSTRQITQYANRILQGLPERTRTPIAYGRGGARPALVRSINARGMGKAIAEAVRDLTARSDIRTVAVLTKWQQTARDLGKVLIEHGIGEVGVLNREEEIKTDVVVSPIILTKGLEFDAVVVANVGKNNFNETEFDRMLLYLACTRARHHLEIHWHGTRSPIVPDVERLRR